MTSLLKKTEDYNLPFLLAELKQSLQKSNDSATALDDVHYQLLTYLPDTVLSILLQTYIEVWESGSFSPSWCEIVIIPIPKPRKDTSNPNNYRPKALISCLCETMDRMVNAGLIWSLET